MTIEDIEIWEKHNGVFDQKCILIMRTGWEEKYENKKEYFGTQTPLDTKTYHFPGMKIFMLLNVYIRCLLTFQGYHRKLRNG